MKEKAAIQSKIATTVGDWHLVPWKGSWKHAPCSYTAEGREIRDIYTLILVIFDEGVLEDMGWC